MKLYGYLLKREIYQIIYVQDVFSQYEDFLAAVTKAFDPKVLFLTVIPVVAGLSTTLYSKLLLSVLLTEYANTIVKWILAEDRPFWWLNETKEFSSLNRPKIYQNELTCEPSPGNPSGHLMTSTTYLFVIFSVLEEYLAKYGRFARVSLRFVYYSTLFFISISRMYFGCHFLHQCIFGILLGILMSKVCLSHRLEKYIAKQSGKRRVGFVVLICLAMLSLYWAQKLLGIDPQWAVKMIAVLAFAAVVAAKPQHQPAAQYPAGVDPSRCPSYPNCDNAALHSPNPYNNHAANHWNPNWNAQPSWNAAPAPAPAPAAYYHGAPHSYQALTGPSHNYIGAPSPSAGGDRYPAGVNPQSCPNYPYCDNTVQAGVPQVAPLPGYTSRQYPAGVSPHTCPNFPYC